MIDSVTPLPSAPPILENLSFAYVKRPGLFKTMMTNFLLGVVTLSIWHFWGKTNVRKHIWSCIHINGEPLEYTGTGGELFRGFFLVFLIFILPILLLTAGLSIYLGPEHPAIRGMNLIFFVAGYLLGGFALYKARNYQLSRTNWRGIRGNMSGSAGLYSLTYFGSVLAKSFSLGWATPVMNVVMSEQMVGDMRFGDSAFKFKGRAGPLYPTYALCWFLTFFAIVGAGTFFIYGLVHLFGANFNDAFQHVFKTNDSTKATPEELQMVGFFTLGIMGLILVYVLLIPSLWAIYIAKELRTLASYTRFDGAQFKINATAGNVILLAIGNLLIIALAVAIAAGLVAVTVFFTIWIGFEKSTAVSILGGVFVLIIYQAVWAFTRPIITQRNIAFVFKRLNLEGAVDLDRIRQSIAARPTRGEGLADAFDLGAW